MTDTVVQIVHVSSIFVVTRTAEMRKFIRIIKSYSGSENVNDSLSSTDKNDLKILPIAGNYVAR